MLTKFFKPAWQSSSVEKRLGAIADLQVDNFEHQKILLQLASDDDDESVRIAAMQELVDIEVLHELSKLSPDSQFNIAAENRLNELMAASQSIDEAQYHNLLKFYPELHFRIAIHADFSSIQNLAIQTLTNKQLLAVLGITRHTDCRQSIAERFSDITSLESARKMLRGKDKNAERIIKSKIDSFRCHERELAKNQLQIEKLTGEAEYLAAHDWLPEFQARCRTHRRQWDSLTFNIEDSDLQRYQIARDLVNSHYLRQQEIEHSQQSQQQLLVDLDALLKITSQRDITASLEAQSEVQLQLEQFGTSWQTLAKITTADEPTVKQYEKMFGAIQSSIVFVTNAAELLQSARNDISQQPLSILKLTTALKGLKWSNDLTKLQSTAEVEQQLLDWRNLLEATAQAQRDKLAKVHKNISSITRFSRAGNLARANQVAQKVQKILNSFNDKEQQALQERFDEASKMLGDMGDWKNFATEPKYMQLCDSMELLSTSKQHADKRTSDMKKLQQQWKSLGHSEISEQYWPRFKLAADKVYEVCAIFFEQRHSLRQDNLEQREHHLEKMRELLESTNWAGSPDYKAAQSIVYNIDSSFSKVKDIERNAGKKQWQHYSKLKAAVMAKINVVYDDNIAQKHQLINQAETLAETTALLENLTSLKSLQTKWKQIGVTRRSEDQKAWKVFKKHSDIVYNKVQELRQKLRNETDQQLDANRNIIKAISQLAKSVNDLSEADQQFSELQTSYNQLLKLPQHLPEKLLESIRRDYRSACDQFDNCRSRIIKGKHNRQLDGLRQKASLCNQLEVLAASASEQQLKAISHQWDSIELNNPALAQRIEARREQASAVIDRGAITAERRMMCIKLEILTGVESPSEDKSLRMQYQLQQMNQSGLSQSVINENQQVADIELDWLCMPGAETKQQVVLCERFQRLLSKT